MVGMDRSLVHLNAASPIIGSDVTSCDSLEEHEMICVETRASRTTSPLLTPSLALDGFDDVSLSSVLGESSGAATRWTRSDGSDSLRAVSPQTAFYGADD